MAFNIHTPDGMTDMTFRETYEMRGLIQKIISCYEGFGYLQIQTPTLEYYDLFENGFHNMYKLFDSDGSILVLRPEMTTPVARFACKNINNHALPFKASYVGQAFRNTPSFKSGGQNEFTQSGVECFGSKSAHIDAEIIAATICTLQKCNLSDFCIELGEASLFSSLAECAGIDPVLFPSLLEYIDKKDVDGLSNFLDDVDIQCEIKQAIISLPSLFGGVDVLNKTSNFPLKTLAAIDNLRNVFKILCDYGFEKYISIDLGMVRTISYYDGIIFKCYAKGLGFALAAGGRYDGLVKDFGADIGAAGGCIWIQRLLSVLFRQNYAFPCVELDVVILYEPNNHQQCIQKATLLRDMGKKVLTIELTNHTYNLQDHWLTKNAQIIKI